MSTKFTAMGRLPILSTLGTPGPTGERVQILGLLTWFAGPRRRLRHIQLELCAGLCLFCVALLLAFLI